MNRGSCRHPLRNGLVRQHRNTHTSEDHVPILTLEVLDDAELDGDTISILLNELPVLAAYGLSHAHGERIAPVLGHRLDRQ